MRDVEKRDVTSSLSRSRMLIKKRDARCRDKSCHFERSREAKCQSRNEMRDFEKRDVTSSSSRSRMLIKKRDVTSSGVEKPNVIY